MRFFLFLFSVIVMNFSLFSQGNLVPNGGFGTMVSPSIWCGTPFECQFGRGGGGSLNCYQFCCDNISVNTTPPLDNLIPFVSNWQCMNNQMGSADYYNPCFTLNIADTKIPIVGVPDNVWGNNLQDFNGDNAYCGLIARNAPGGGNYSEYLVVGLNSGLAPNTTYKAIMHVRRPASCQYACAGLGMCFVESFSSFGPSGDGTSNIQSQFTPQVVSTNVISSTDWVEVSGLFTTTTGFENWLIIGVFDPNLSQPVLINGSANTVDQSIAYPQCAYYFIDGVSIVDGGNQCCLDHQDYSATSNLPQLTEVNNYIEATSFVSSLLPQGPVIVQAGQNVTFQAGNAIFLEPGFSTQPGAFFKTIIAPCHDYDIYPFPSTVVTMNGGIIPDAIEGCPGYTPFVIDATGVGSYTMFVYDASNGQQIYNSGLNRPTDGTGAIGIWDLSYTGHTGSGAYPFGGDNIPPFYVFDYELWLYYGTNPSNVCNNPKFYKGNITVEVNCVDFKLRSPLNNKNKSSSDSTSISNTTSIFFKVYPNPNNGTMYVNYLVPESDQEVLEIFDMAGRLVLNYTLPGGQNSLVISNPELQSGLYYYQAISYNKIIAQDKLVIIK